MLIDVLALDMREISMLFWLLKRIKFEVSVVTHV